MKQDNFIKFHTVISKENLLDFLRKTANNQDLRVVVLSFTNDETISEKSVYDAEIYELLKNFHIPIITIIKSFAAGFLFDVVILSHICISSNSSKFETKDIQKIEHQIGAKNIAILDSLNEIIDAKTALDIGIINKAVEEENLGSEALEMAKTISSLAPVAIRSCLKAVNKGLEMNLEDGLKLETELFTKIFATKDMKEGTSAFFEKRKPIFSGK